MPERFGIFCCEKPPDDIEKKEKGVSAEVELVVERVTLTVAESKRLIARGLMRDAPVVEKMGNGVVMVCRGSSNTYLAEELQEKDLAGCEN